MSNDVEEAARAALAPAARKTLLANTAIQEAVLRAKEAGATRDEWMQSASQTWAAIEKAEEVVVARIAGALDAPAG